MGKTIGGTSPYFSNVLDKNIWFKLKVHKTRYYFKVFAFEFKDKMVAAKMRFKQEDEWDLFAVDDFEACLCPFQRFKYVDGKRVDTDFHPHIGNLYFWANSLSPDIVAHELIHALTHYERVVNMNHDCKLGDDIGEIEEDFCDRHTNMMREFAHKLEKIGGIYLW